MCITEIEGKDNRAIVNPDDIREELNKHIQEILHGSNLITSDIAFINYISGGNIKYNLITDNGTNGK